jgi:hypothetical protein
MVEVARAIPVRVVGGERSYAKGDFARLLEARVIDVVQPEILRCGGVSGLTKIAALAEAYEAFVAPHNAQSPFTTVVNAHVGAALLNLLIQECFDDFLVPWSREIMSGTVRIVDGFIEVPDGPGFGVALDEAEMAKYPYAERNFLRLFEAGWERRGFQAGWNRSGRPTQNASCVRWAPAGTANAVGPDWTDQATCVTSSARPSTRPCRGSFPALEAWERVVSEGARTIRLAFVPTGSPSSRTE